MKPLTNTPGESTLSELGETCTDLGIWETHVLRALVDLAQRLSVYSSDEAQKYYFSDPDAQPFADDANELVKLLKP